MITPNLSDDIDLSPTTVVFLRPGRSTVSRSGYPRLYAAWRVLLRLCRERFQYPYTERSGQGCNTCDCHRCGIYPIHQAGALHTLIRRICGEPSALVPAILPNRNPCCSGHLAIPSRHLDRRVSKFSPRCLLRYSYVSSCASYSGIVPLGVCSAVNGFFDTHILAHTALWRQLTAPRKVCKYG